MPIEIEYEPNEICVLRIRGVLKQSEFAAKQSALADKIDVGAKPRVLAIVENFEGFERGAPGGIKGGCYFWPSRGIAATTRLTTVLIAAAFFSSVFTLALPMPRKTSSREVASTKSIMSEP